MVSQEEAPAQPGPLLPCDYTAVALSLSGASTPSPVPLLLSPRHLMLPQVQAAALLWMDSWRANVPADFICSRGSGYPDHYRGPAKLPVPMDSSPSFPVLPGKPPANRASVPAARGVCGGSALMRPIG